MSNCVGTACEDKLAASNTDIFCPGMVWETIIVPSFLVSGKETWFSTKSKLQDRIESKSVPKPLNIFWVGTFISHLGNVSANCAGLVPRGLSGSGLCPRLHLSWELINHPTLNMSWTYEYFLIKRPQTTLFTCLPLQMIVESICPVSLFRSSRGFSSTAKELLKCIPMTSLGHFKISWKTVLLRFSDIL